MLYIFVGHLLQGLLQAEFLVMYTKDDIHNTTVHWPPVPPCLRWIPHQLTNMSYFSYLFSTPEEPNVTPNTSDPTMGIILSHACNYSIVVPCVPCLHHPSPCVARILKTILKCIVWTHVVINLIWDEGHDIPPVVSLGYSTILVRCGSRATYLNQHHPLTQFLDCILFLFLTFCFFVLFFVPFSVS